MSLSIWREVLKSVLQIPDVRLDLVLRGLVAYAVRTAVQRTRMLVIASLFSMLLHFLWVTVLCGGFGIVSAVLVPQPGLLLPVGGLAWSLLSCSISTWSAYRLVLIRRAAAALGLLLLLFEPSLAHNGGWAENGGLTGYFFDPNSWTLIPITILSGPLGGLGWIFGIDLGNALGGTGLPPAPPAGLTPDQQEAINRFKNDEDYHRRQADYWRSKLGETTDPAARNELERRFLYHDHMASDCRDQAAAVSSDGIVRHTPTSLDTLNRDMMTQQGQQQAQELRDKLAAIQAQTQSNIDRRNQYNDMLDQVNSITDPARRELARRLVAAAGRVDSNGVPQGDLGRIQRFIQNQQKPEQGYGTVEQIWDTTVGTLKGTGNGVLNVVTLGYSGVVQEHSGKGDLGSALGKHTADLVTFGFYSGYQKGGVMGGVEGVGNTVLPIQEVGVLLPGSGATWDQRAGALGSGILKVLTLGKAGGKMISSRPMTAAEIANTKYGYHFTTPQGKAGIMSKGFETRAAGSHGGASGLVSKTASKFKQAFVDNEPSKAGYMWGTSKPGGGRMGDLDYKAPPVVIDLSKVDPSKLMVRPSDGAIIFTGNRIPPSALKAPTSWSGVPVSGTPLTARPLGNLPQALPWAGANRATGEAFNQTSGSSP